MLLTPLVVKNPEDAKNMTNVYIHRIQGVKKELRLEQMEWYKKLSGINDRKSAGALRRTSGVRTVSQSLTGYYPTKNI